MAYMRSEKRQNMRGFTLLEVLVAITLLAIALLATASMQGVALKRDTIANKMSIGSMLAQQAADEMLSRAKNDPSYNVFLVASAGTCDLDPLTPSNTLDIPGAGIFQATFTTTLNDGITGLTRIDITVTSMSTNTFGRENAVAGRLITHKMVL